LVSADERHGHVVRRQGGGVRPKQGSLIEEPAVRTALRRIVVRMEENPHLREDLWQEACIHFWFSEQQCPGQRLGWYLQRVQFHLRHLRTSGRSLDSPRHRGARVDSADRRDDWLDALDLDEGVVSEVNAHDILCVLADRLGPIDQKILGALVDGLGICDIAEKLAVSHMFVVRHRRRIARLAIELGIGPVPGS
jgi:DNA-directed RNA polymerase specialized sigma24 family protein